MYKSDLTHRDATLQAKLERLYTLNRGKIIDLSFRPAYIQLLEKFGNPHLNLPPVIHIAGTNGKGSILATLKSILKAAGYKIHAYTSPHLVNFNERIELAGHEISDETLENMIDQALEFNGDNEITFFEITTAIAFAAFQQIPADILLLEVGMGGRLDCTNIIETSALSIISGIALDHMEYLGTTLEKIAAEKAGIIRTRTPCIVSHQSHPEILKILQHLAAQKNTALYSFGEEWNAVAEKGRLFFKYGEKEYSYPLPSLQGAHQIYNAGAALAALKTLENSHPVSEAAIAKGLQTICWPGRLQNISEYFALPDQWEIWLDGAHNDDAARALARQARQWGKDDPKKLDIIFGMLQGRTPENFLQILRPHIDTLHLVDIGHEPKAWQTVQIKENLEGLFENIPVWCQPDYRDALKNIEKTKNHSLPRRILITGSLYLAGHVLKTLEA